MAERAVLFDLDGTLWDSRPFYAELIGRGHPGAAKDALDALAARQPAATLLRHAGLGPGRFAAHCRNGCATYPGVREALTELARSDVALGAVTNLPAWIAEPMLSSSGLAQLLPVVVSYGHARRPKPAGDPLLLAAHRLGVRSRPELWYVGDDDVDARAARAAGMSFAWASWGYGHPAPVPTDRTLATAGDITEL